MFGVNWLFCFLKDFRLYHAGFQLLLHPCPKARCVAYGEARHVLPAESAERALEHAGVIGGAYVTLAKFGPEFVICVHFCVI